MERIVSSIGGLRSLLKAALPCAVVALACFVQVRAAVTRVCDLGEAAFADTEVSTNLPLRVDLSRLRALQLDLSLTANPSNALEVAVGHDADGSGTLEVAESAVTFGCDCGRWFVRDAAMNVTPFPGLAVGAASRRHEIPRGGFDPSWDVMRITKRGRGEIGERVVERDRKTYLHVILH